MAKFKLTLKKKSLEEKVNLCEHVNIEGATYIGTADGVDVFDVRTWAAQQSFVTSHDEHRRCNFTQGQDEFEHNIGEDHPIHLYLFAIEDTNRVTGAAITNAGSANIHYGDSQSYLTVNIKYENEEGGTNIPAGTNTPVYLIPGTTFTLHAADNWHNNESAREYVTRLCAVANIEAPEAPAPAEEPTQAETTPVVRQADAEDAFDDAEENDEDIITPAAFADDGDATEEEPAADEEHAEQTETDLRTATNLTAEEAQRRRIKYKVVNDEVHITHMNFYASRILVDSPTRYFIDIPDTIEGKPVTTLERYCLFIPIALGYWDTVYIKVGDNFKEVKPYAIVITNQRRSNIVFQYRQDSNTAQAQKNSTFMGKVSRYAVVSTDIDGSSVLD